MTTPTRSLPALLLLFALAACTNVPAPGSGSPAVGPATAALAQPSAETGSPASTAMVCALTKPAWLKPPADSAVQSPPAFGYYFVNADRSIWASAWWTGQEASYLRASKDGVKFGWFRPAGARLEIAGRRIDAPAPPLRADVPCCYPTRFQATGLYFPTEGCWEVTARAADSELSFVVWVEP